MRAILLAALCLAAAFTLSCTADSGDLAATPAAPRPAEPFRFLPGQIPTPGASILESKQVEALGGGTMRLRARVNSDEGTFNFVQIFPPPLAASLQACWDAATIGAPVPPCMQTVLDQQPARGPNNPLDLATPDPALTA